MVCQHKPNQWLHSPLGNAHTLCLHSPDFGTDVYQTYPSIPVTSECKKLGTCVTDAALHLHVHCVTSSTLPALIQAFERRHDHTCRGVAEAETIIFRLWLTAKFPADAVVCLSDFPCGGTVNLEQKEGETISLPTALPTQKTEGHTLVPFTTEMLAMKPGKPSHTLDLKIIPEEKNVLMLIIVVIIIINAY